MRDCSVGDGKGSGEKKWTKGENLREEGKKVMFMN